MNKQSDRDKKGRFRKGGKAGPGRPKGEPKDIVCKDGKKRSVEALIEDLLATYGSLGGPKFLKAWALISQNNLRKFVEILFRFAPQPDVFTGNTNIQVVSAVPRIDDRAMAKRIRDLEAELKMKDEELHGFRASAHAPDEGELEHEPVRLLSLPAHGNPGIKDMTDDELDLEIARIQKEIKDGKVKKKAL